jgi:hypothetical protein
MEMIFCPNCNKLTGYKRSLGFGTLFAVLLTAGLWLLALPFYPKRCITCGLAKSDSVPWYRTWRVVVLPFLFCVGIAVLVETNKDRSTQMAPIVKGPDYNEVPTSTVANKAPDANAQTTQMPQAPRPHRAQVDIPSPKKRPIPIRMDEVTVLPTPDGHHNVQMVKGAFPMNAIGQPDVPVWLMCNDVNSTCYPLRPGQLYWGTAINLGEEGYSSCYPADNSDSFCTQIHGTYEGEEKLVVYVMGVAKREQQYDIQLVVIC